MLGNYSKLIAAIIGAIVARMVLKYTGLDLAALGIQEDVNGLVYLLVESGVTGIAALITSLFVYFFPANRPQAKAPEPTGDQV